MEAKRLSTPDYAGMRSLPELFFKQADKLQQEACLWGKRDGVYQPHRWSELAARTRLLARGLIARGIQPGDRVVLVCENRPEWLIAHLAIICAGGVSVPAYVTNTEHDHLHILTNSEAVAALVSTKSLARPLLPAAVQAPDCRFLAGLEGIETHQARTFEVASWDRIAAEGEAAQNEEELDRRIGALKRDGTALFIYTSGTGGTPKGVMLSHANILANCYSAYDLLKSLGLESQKQVFLSFLPLSHSYEHAAGLFFPLSIGAEIYYAESIEQLANNMKEARPTIMTAVPRLYETMYQRITLGLKREKPMKQKLFARTLELGLKKGKGQSLTMKERIEDAALDRLVRSKVRERFGGRLQAFVSGGAALNPDVGYFFQALGLRLLQGYGQTEASPVVSCNRPNKVKMESVGPPLAGVEVKTAEDGEILVRGENVMLGYWGEPEFTAEVVKDGWLHTGDVGHIDEDGYIYITDRKKDIIVISGGDNVSPARIEGLLTLEPEIEQAMIYGDKRSYLVALLVPSPNTVTEAGGLDNLDRAALKKSLSKALERVNERLSVLERVRRFAVTCDPFSIENEMLTPTMKIRRHVIKKRYGELLEGLYEGKRQS